MTSDYAKTLSGEVLERYETKVALIGVDPYTINLKLCSKDLSDFPKVHYFDICNYLKYAKSPYTDEELRAIKSTEAYKFYVCGWVRDLAVKKCGSSIVILGKVCHSQRLREKLLSPWVISTPEGKILGAHCTCVAGLGESCAHVGCILFAIEDAVRNHEPKSVTQTKAYWKAPSEVLGAQKQVATIDFQNPKRKFEGDHYVPPKPPAAASRSEPTEEEKTAFLNKLHETGVGSAILEVKEPYCSEIQKQRQVEETRYLTALFKEDLLNESLETLIQMGQDIGLKISKEECLTIEKSTRSFANRKEWFGYRSGRITASNFKRACRTKIEKPSLSLVKQICYPAQYTFTTAATRYGCQHEITALQAYEKESIEKHQNLKVLSQVGLVINEKYPHFGATPDSVVSCDCCGLGCVEVKCPYCVRDVNIQELKDLKKLCLEKSDKGLTLERNHSYFFQIQMQMAVTDRRYCDFVVWTRKSLFIERVNFDNDFWERESTTASNFHKNVIVPELLSKYFTRSSESSSQDLQPNPESEPEPLLVWCICKQPDSGTGMIACENDSCEIVWFHFSCVGLTETPNYLWYCESCRTDEASTSSHPN